MSHRGQILADELLISCKRYIRFRETGSPDAVEVSPQERLYKCDKCGLLIQPVIHERQTLACPDCKTYTAHRVPSQPTPPAGRAGEREEKLAKALKHIKGNYQPACPFCVEHRDKALAALAPSEGEEDSTEREKDWAQIAHLKEKIVIADEAYLQCERELAEARAAIREAAKIFNHGSGSEVTEWLASPAVLAALTPTP